MGARRAFSCGRAAVLGVAVSVWILFEGGEGPRCEGRLGWLKGRAHFQALRADAAELPPPEGHECRCFATAASVAYSGVTLSCPGDARLDR
jgi:hypothetical protein